LEFSAWFGFTNGQELEGSLSSIAAHPTIGFKSASALPTSPELALTKCCQMSDATGLLPFSRSLSEPIAPAIKWAGITRRIGRAYPLIPAERPHFFVALDTLKLIAFHLIFRLERTAKQKRGKAHNT
jgi:hypothetical protein